MLRDSRRWLICAGRSHGQRGYVLKARNEELGFESHWFPTFGEAVEVKRLIRSGHTVASAIQAMHDRIDEDVWGSTRTGTRRRV